MQLTISSYLFGFAVGQIFYGPISDRIGRKPVLLTALVLYGFGSIGCAAAQSIHGLIAMRFLQALGGAGAIVLARAVVRDIYSGARASRELSVMGAITAFAPIVAPTIGGVLQVLFGWRAIFVMLVIFAAVAADRPRRGSCPKRCTRARQGRSRCEPWPGFTARCWCIAAFSPISAS